MRRSVKSNTKHLYVHGKMENSNDNDESMERHGDEGRKKSKFRVLAGESSTAQMCV